VDRFYTRDARAQDIRAYPLDHSGCLGLQSGRVHNLEPRETADSVLSQELHPGICRELLQISYERGWNVRPVRPCLITRIVLPLLLLYNLR